MLVTAGAKIPVGAPIFISVDDESNIAAFTDYKVVSIASPTPSSPTPTPAPKPTPIVTAPVTPIPPATKVSQIQETKPIPNVNSTKQTEIVKSDSYTFDGRYSVRVNPSFKSTSPLNNKLKADQLNYSIKYGRTVVPPVATKKACK